MPTPGRCLHCASIGVEAPVDTTLVRGSVPPSSDRGHLERPTGVERSLWACWRRAGLLLPWRSLRSGLHGGSPPVETTQIRGELSSFVRYRSCRATIGSRDTSLVLLEPFRNAVSVEMSPLHLDRSRGSGRHDVYSWECAAFFRSWSSRATDGSREISWGVLKARGNASVMEASPLRPSKVGPPVEATYLRRGMPFPNRSAVVSSGHRESRHLIGSVGTVQECCVRGDVSTSPRSELRRRST